MSGLGKGLKKEDRSAADAKVDDFAKGAAERVEKLKPSKKTKGRVYKTYTFSLTEEVSADIDRLSCAPSDFRSNRSDVVKAGVMLLKQLPQDKLVNLLKQLKQAK